MPVPPLASPPPPRLHFQAFPFLSRLLRFSMCFCSTVALWSARTRSWAQYPQEFTTRKTEVVKMTVCEFQSLYLVDLYIAHVIHSKKNLTVSIEYIYNIATVAVQSVIGYIGSISLTFLKRNRKKREERDIRILLSSISLSR